MRCEQFIGLNERAEKLIQTRDTTCKCCGRGGKELVKISGKYMSDGAFGEPPTLLPGYLLKKSIETAVIFESYRRVYEFVQAVFFSSGPVVFTALKDVDGRVIGRSLWSPEEMEQSL